jgi:Transposase DDE domain
MLINYRGKCTLPIYIRFLVAQPMRAECTKLSHLIPDMTHDAVNRFLSKSQFTGQDLFNLIKGQLILEGGILSVDDTTLDKPYSKLNKCSLLSLFYSGKHKRSVKGLSLITLVYTDPRGIIMPVHYAVVGKNENRNKLFRDMLQDVIDWGIKAKAVSFDNAYATLENFELINDCHLDCLFGIAINQELYINNEKKQLSDLLFGNKQGKTAQCSMVGTVKIFRQYYPDLKETRHYAFHSEDSTRIKKFNRKEFRFLRARHWGIERYHRGIKQNCCIEKFMVRNTQAILNHIFCALMAFCYIEKQVVEKVQKSWYKFKNAIINHSLSQFIQNINQKNLINTKSYTSNLLNTDKLILSPDSS